MKRDMELVRTILLHIEQEDNLDFKVDAPETVIAYHVRLLNEADLIHAAVLTAIGGKIILQETGMTRLTWKGHQFIDAARDESRWQKAMKKVSSIGGSVTFGALQQLLTTYMKQQLGIP